MAALDEMRRPRLVQISSHAGVYQPRQIHQPYGLEQAFLAGIQQVIAGAVHQLEAHGLEIGGDAQHRAVHAAAQRSLKRGFIANE